VSLLTVTAGPGRRPLEERVDLTELGRPPDRPMSQRVRSPPARASARNWWTH